MMPPFKTCLLLILLSSRFLFSRELVIDVQIVSGGASNSSYRVHIDNRDLFLRIGDTAGEEFKYASQAHQIGLTPEIICYNPALKFVIYPFINSVVRKLDFSVLDPIRKLHCSGIVFDRTFNPFDEILEYRQHASEEILFAVESLRSEMSLRTDTPCHLDIHMDNFLFEMDKIWMIDWEHAAMGDPLFDLAVFASTENLDVEQTRTLLNIYFEREVTSKELETFAKMRFLADVRWGLWSYEKLETNNLNWDYKGDAKRYMKSATRYLEGNKKSVKKIHMENSL